MAAPEAALAEAPASCAATDARAFPLAARIRGGPGDYEAGGGFGTWYIDLTNTTHRTCTDIHPVVVLVDDKRALKPDQTKLEFYDGDRVRPVAFDATDEQELVGVLDGAGFKGFTVPAGRTVSVKIRLALTSDAVSDEVTARAAVVQRRGADGDWVGESNAYQFGIGQDGDATPDEAGTGDVQEARTTPPGTPQATPGAGTPTAGSSLPFAREAQEAGERVRELARTGLGLARGPVAAVAVALLGVGSGVFLLVRSRR
nr:hypothetical protein [Streptomyces pluripotens]